MAIMKSLSFFSLWTMYVIARKRTVKGGNSTVRFGSEAGGLANGN